MLFSEFSFKRYNFRILLYMLILSAIGLMAIWSATNQNRPVLNKQIMGIGVGMVLAIFLSLFDYHKLLSFSTIIYLACVVMLGAVLAMGTSRGVATRWIVLPVIGQIQPAEFVKIGLILFFSWYFQKYQEKKNQISILGLPFLFLNSQTFLPH